MADFAVNVPREIEDLTYNPRQPGKTNLAYGAYENPNTFSAMTSDGDFAGEVGADYNGKIRIIDPMNGEPLFEGSGNQAVGAAFTAVNEIAKEKGRNASWAVQIDDGNGGWATAASDFVDAKKSSPLSMLADIALPIIGSILMPFAAPAFAAMSAMGAAAAGAALGSLTSSAAQGRSVDEALKRALVSAATAGAASGVSSAITSAAVKAGTQAIEGVAAQTAATGTGQALANVGGQTAANAAGNTIGELVVQGVGAGTQALAGGANLAVNLAGNMAANSLQGGTGSDSVTTQPTTPVETQPSLGAEAAPYVSEVVIQAVKDGASLSQIVAMGVPVAVAAGLIASTGSTGAAGTGAMTSTAAPVATVASEAAVPAGTTTAAGGAVTSAALTTPAGFATTAEMLASANAALAGGGIAAWIAAHPAAAAQLGLTALGAVAGGSGVDGNGLATGGGTPPALQQSALFKKALPTPSGIFANLSPRDVSKSVTDWNNYGAGPEQSFFNSVPVRASGVTPDPKLVVTPSNPTTPTSPTTGTATNPQTPTNLAVQNMTKYGQTPGVLDLRNQPTSVDNPYAGYATTRTPPQGAVELPATSNARFVVQEPMTAEDLAKQARMSAMTVGMPTDKSDLSVRTTGTPPERTAPASASATAPTGRPTDAYSPADLERIRVTMGPDTVASMMAINDRMVEKAKREADMKPLGEGLMSQWQLDQEGLKTPPPAAPKGVDPGAYYFMTQKMQGMTPAEIDAYNARVEAAPELLGTKKMAQINSPEWFAENFGLNEKQANIAAADVVGKKSPSLAVNVPATPTNVYVEPKPKPAEVAPAPTLVNPDLAVARSTPTPAEPAAPTPVATQQNYALNVPEDVMKQLESYNFQFKHGGTTSKAFAVNGAGDGRADKIDAKLSDGEYVIDAETVALLGNGSSRAGAQQLDKFRVNIRKHKGQKLASGKFSANAKSPEAYMAGGRS
jgi:hypothetical protein